MARKTKADGVAPYSYRKSNVDVKFDVKDLPWTFKQQQLIQTLQKKSTKCGLIKGPAGSSKTIIAIYVALQLLRNKNISDITYVRSAVESSSSKLGFLPGDIKDKFQVYGIPFQEKLEELLAPNIIKVLKEDNRVKTLPINFLRGLNFSGNLVILDESQNFTKDELVTAITRIGEHSRVWFLGDPNQSDLPFKHKNDFSDFCSKLSDKESEDNGIVSFDFDVDDIVRSEFCKFVVRKLKIYENSEYKKEESDQLLLNFEIPKTPDNNIWVPSQSLAV